MAYQYKKIPPMGDQAFNTFIKCELMSVKMAQSFLQPLHHNTVTSLFGLVCRKAAVKPARPVLTAAQGAKFAAKQRLPRTGGRKRQSPVALRILQHIWQDV